MPCLSAACGLPTCAKTRSCHRRALSLGVVSQRRIWAEATSVLQQAPEQAPPQGLNPLALLSWLLTSSGGAAAVAKRQRKAAAAAAAVQARDFHAQMAAGRQGRWAPVACCVLPAVCWLLRCSLPLAICKLDRALSTARRRPLLPRPTSGKRTEQRCTTGAGGDC